MQFHTLTVSTAVLHCTLKCPIQFVYLLSMSQYVAINVLVALFIISFDSNEGVCWLTYLTSLISLVYIRRLFSLKFLLQLVLVISP